METTVLVDIHYHHLKNYYNFIKEIEFKSTNYLEELLEKYPFDLYLTREVVDYSNPYSFTGVTLTLNIPLKIFFMLNEFGLV